MKESLMQQLDRVLVELCEKGVNKGVFPGAAAAVSVKKKGERERVIQAVGKTRNDDIAGWVTKETFFDLASLTKPLATSLSILCLVEKGVIKMDDTLGTLLECKIRLDKKNIKLEELLSHSSGLSPYRPYFELFRPEVLFDNKKRIIQHILNDPLEYKPGTECRYSDLGFILLGKIIETKSGYNLDSFYRENITVPLGLEQELFFLPLPKVQKKNKKIFAATEDCPWRRRVIQGEVHDEHCWLMGGVSGHAGLFGTVDGVLTLCEHLLGQWQGREEHPFYSGALLQKALQRKYAGRTWCLGFDTPSPSGSSGGRYLSAKSVGHLGYAGTSFWIDPEKETTMVLLSNRVHPSRENKKIREFRPWFHDRLMEFLFPSLLSGK